VALWLIGGVRSMPSPTAVLGRRPLFHVMPRVPVAEAICWRGLSVWSCILEVSTGDVMAQFVRGNPGGPGKPSRYNVDVGAAICMQLIEGQSLRSICKQDGRPHVATFLRWVDQHEPLRRQYAIAKEIQGHMIYDYSLRVSRAASPVERELVVEDAASQRRCGDSVTL
jgi:hypothetical protein